MLVISRISIQKPWAKIKACTALKLKRLPYFSKKQNPITLKRTPSPIKREKDSSLSEPKQTIKQEGKQEREREREREREMYRCSNTVIGYLNLLTLLASIPIIGGGLWLARSSATCVSSLETPLLVLGFVILLVSLAGFVGACFNVAWALWLYLLVMLGLIAGLLGLTAFGFAVTGGGGGVEVPGRVYREFRLGDYSGWLRRRITEERYWQAARACVVGSRVCAKIATWTPLDYLQHDLTPIQSGCCKPPTACTYDGGMAMAAQDEDCYRWNNAADVLCYMCDSCKAGVLEQVRRDWHKLSVLNVIILIFLIAIYAVGCCAFRNARRSLSDHPYGENHMSKVRPRWDYYWWRWWRDWKEQLY